VALTVPIDLELRAGDSVAILCDDATHAAALGEVMSGRRSPLAGEISVDGVELTAEDRLVALVARGEAFVVGDLERNLSALCDEPVAGSTVAAVREACALDEVEQERAGIELKADGAPLADVHRLLLLAARVMPSSYRVLVVVDPVPWVNAVRAELWRSAVVRASLGRTAIWITSDRDLARRAGSTVELRAGTLRSARPDLKR
jgi:predicted ABC-type transport system involved in lysophospholipase L1 biosynthesis ATPase subunit